MPGQLYTLETSASLVCLLGKNWCNVMKGLTLDAFSLCLVIEDSSLDRINER